MGHKSVAAVYRIAQMGLISYFVLMPQGDDCPLSQRSPSCK